ncbi:hypothetical protein LN893_17975 [Pontibacter sp. XAAS-A31]|nr:hypothetical protein [Pontibacter harenae]
MLVLLLLISHFSVACGTDVSETGTEKQQAIRRRGQTADTLSVKHITTGAPTSNDFLSNPFIIDSKQSRKLDAYFARINADFTVDANAIENLHKPSISDTIYTIRFGNSVLELYAPTQTGDLLLQLADIQNTGILLRNNMKIGMTQPELMVKLKTHDVRIIQTTNEVVATNNEGAPISLHFYLKNGKVNRIRYNGYLD